MDAVWWAAVVIGVVTTVIVGVIGIWLMVRHRRRDRKAETSSVVESLVRECEGRRVLWNPFSREEPEASYAAVQALRQAVRSARGQLPSGSPGIAELDQLKQAAEAFCDGYEYLLRSRTRFGLRAPIGSRPLEDLIRTLRARFLPALERLREQYDIPAGHRPTTENPFIGEPVRRINLQPSGDETDER